MTSRSPLTSAPPPPPPPSAIAAAALADPAVHRQCEQDFVRHVGQLLGDDRLRIDTTRGRRPIAGTLPAVARTDRAVDLKRVMTELRRPDRDLQHRMPVGEAVDVVLRQKRFVVLTTPIGRLVAVCTSPTRALLAGADPHPLRPAEVTKLIADLPPGPAVPTTVVVMSTSGFTMDAYDLADRRGNRTVILVEPNLAGGWTVHGPVETKALNDLFDPEADDSKRARVREEVDAAVGELTGAGLASDRVAATTRLPLLLVESALRDYAKAHPGLVAKRLDGRVVLFREGSVPAAATSATGGGEMPLLDRIKTLFARKGEYERKISFLSERRAALMQQQARGYEEIGGLEGQEARLRTEFKAATGDVTKRRVTGQLLQLRKDIERRQQLMQVLNQQVTIVSTHLHNLELVHQGRAAQLPDSEEVAADAAKAEEMLAGLQADAELAGSVGGISLSGMSDEERALYEELEKESAAAATVAEKAEPEPAKAAAVTPPAATATSDRTTSVAATRRAEPEAG